MPEETNLTAPLPPTIVQPKALKISPPEVQQHTEPAAPSNPDYDGEGRLINQKVHAEHQAARKAILRRSS